MSRRMRTVRDALWLIGLWIGLALLFEGVMR